MYSTYVARRRKRFAGLGRQVSAIILALVLVLLATAIAGAQDKMLYWERYDVDITVQTNSDLRVVETQELVFTSGTFRYGVRSIPFLRLEDITGVTVGEAGGREYARSAGADPYTFQVRRAGNDLEIQYNFPPTTGGGRTIVIGYTVVGALRFYPQDGIDQLDWKAIPSGNPFGTSTSTIRLHAPEGASFTGYRLWGARGEPSFEPDGRNGAIRVLDYIPAGHEVEVVAQWPHGIVSGSATAWQLALDARVRRQALLDLAAVGSSLLLAIAVPVLVFIRWYRKARTRPAGLVADYLVEPPEGVSPALAAVLIDVQSCGRAILATIYDLVRRGALQITVPDASSGALLERPGTDRPASAERRASPPREANEELSRFEKAVMKELFRSGEHRALADLGRLFGAEIAGLFSVLCGEMVSHGYCADNRAEAAARRGLPALLLLWAAVLAGLLVLGIQLYASKAFLIALGIAAVGVPFFLTLIGRLPFVSLLGRIDLGISTARSELTSRRIWLWYGLYAYLVVVGIALCNPGSLLICVPLGLGVTAIALLIAAPRLTPLTPAGADAAARCRAFQRYLSNVRHFSEGSGAAAIIDRYQPYAVAFGIDRTWLEEREEAPSQGQTGEGLWERLGRILSWLRQPPTRRPGQPYTPTWWLPTSPHEHGHAGESARPFGIDIPVLDSNLTIPSLLEGMSRSVGDSLSTASSSLGSALSSIASSIAESASSSSSRGGSSGSRSSFSGGGSRRGGGSGGGGSRFG